MVSEAFPVDELAPRRERRTAQRDGWYPALVSIVERGEYVAPHPMMDLHEAIGTALGAYWGYSVEGMPESRLALLRRFIAEAKELLR